jgi:hypothetical protein
MPRHIKGIPEPEQHQFPRIKKIVRYLNTNLKVRVYLELLKVSWKIVLKSLVNI